MSDLLTIQDHDTFETKVKKSVIGVMTGRTDDETIRHLLSGLCGSAKTQDLVRPSMYSIGYFASEQSPTHILAVETQSGGMIKGVSSAVKGDIEKYALPVLTAKDILNSAAISDPDEARVWVLSPSDVLSMDEQVVVTALTKSTPRQHLIVFALGLGNAYIEMSRKLIAFAKSGSPVKLRSDALHALSMVSSAPFYDQLPSEELDFWSLLENELYMLHQSGPNDSVRASALSALAFLPIEPESYERRYSIILDGLNDASDEVRIAAVRSSRYTRDGRSRPRGFADKLQRMLLEDSPAVRKYVAKALLQADESADTDMGVIAEALSVQEMDRTKTASISSDLEDLLILYPRLADSKMREKVRREIDALIRSKYADDERFPFYLGRHRPPSEPELVEQLVAMCSDPDPEIRRRALLVWSHIRSKAVPSVIVGCMKDGDINARLAAIRGLRPGDVEDKRIFDILMNSLKLEHNEIRAAVVHLFAGVRKPELRQEIIDQMLDIIEQDPDHTEAHRILWKMVAQGSDWDDIPF